MTAAMEVFTTKLESVLLIKPPTVFEDFRGHYIETYNRNAYFTAGIPIDFIQDDISVSHRHVLRGIHGDSKTWKLISCLQGSFYMVVVNNDPKLMDEALPSIRRAVGETNVFESPMRMGAEDFSYYEQVIPGCFLRLGSGNRARGIVADSHTAEFDIDEEDHHALELERARIRYAAATAGASRIIVRHT